MNNGKLQLDPAFPPSLRSSSNRPSKSKVVKKHTIHLIKFCLKNGITRNKEIVGLLKENKITLKGRTFDRYKSIAEKELRSDLDADIWLSDKVQNSLVTDYKDISERYDRQLALDDMLMESLVKQAVDKAMKFDNNPEKYYRYLNFNEILKVQTVSNYTMKNKLEFISEGFLMFKIKQCIESLRKQLNQKERAKERDFDISSKLSFLPTSNPNPTPESNKNYLSNEAENEEDDEEYLEQNGLAIGMNGKPIKKYLADIEKRLGKPLSTI